MKFPSEISTLSSACVVKFRGDCFFVVFFENPSFLISSNCTIPFPCQFGQNEIELCQDEIQDRVNEFQFRFREKYFRQYETELLRRK